MNAIPRSRLLIYLFAAFLAGIGMTFVAPWVASRIGDHLLHMEHKEIARETSPDGKVDAVMIRDNCGAPCSFGYSVSVVPRGMNAPADSPQDIFYAEDMEDAKIAWKQPHLLSISYTRALIYKLRNLEYPFREAAASEQDSAYKVEIQLAPSSPTGFSYLQAKNLQ